MDMHEIKARCEAATPGPWLHKQVGEHHGLCHVDTDSISLTPEDWEFIAHARTDVPQLVEALWDMEEDFADLESERNALNIDNQRLRQAIDDACCDLPKCNCGPAYLVRGMHAHDCCQAIIDDLRKALEGSHGTQEGT